MDTVEKYHNQNENRLAPQSILDGRRNIKFKDEKFNLEKKEKRLQNKQCLKTLTYQHLCNRSVRSRENYVNSNGP